MLLGEQCGSCCARVGSGVQTDATFPNNIGTTIVGRMQLTHKILKIVCKASAWP